jgi:hypothetical protein
VIAVTQNVRAPREMKVQLAVAKVKQVPLVT